MLLSSRCAAARLALRLPQPGEARDRRQLQQFRFMAPGYINGTLEAGFRCLAIVRIRRQQAATFELLERRFHMTLLAWPDGVQTFADEIQRFRCLARLEVGASEYRHDLGLRESKVVVA